MEKRDNIFHLAIIIFNINNQQTKGDNMYRDEIQHLIEASPLEIDLDVVLEGRPPSMASSEFLTNKEQGDWAEQIVCKAINNHSEEYIALEYGRSDSISAGDEGFATFYAKYQQELNNIGKKPDLLIFKKADFGSGSIDLENDDHVKMAVAALEVRSSSFLLGKYNSFMQDRQKNALIECSVFRNKILTEPCKSFEHLAQFGQ